MNQEDSLEIFNLRNLDEISKWMVNSDKIPLETHQVFIEELKVRKDKDYFIVKDKENNLIGSVNIDYSEKDTSERGIFINPCFHNQGQARRILEEFYDYIRDNFDVKEVITQVKVDNVASNKLEQRLGAKLHSTKDNYNIFHLILAKKRIILRADAGKKIGYGHFIRSAALGNYLSTDFHCEVATHNPDGLYGGATLSQINTLANNNCEIFPSFGDNLNDFDKEFLNQLDPNDIVILDNYYFSTNYQNAIKAKGCKLVCLHDEPGTQLEGDLCITPSPLKRSDFKIGVNSIFLGGVEYGCLREPFFSPAPHRIVHSFKDVRSIIISFGGSSTNVLIEKLFNIINIIFPQAEINILSSDIDSLAPNIRNQAIVHSGLDAIEIVNLMDNCDLGIFSSSTSCLEAFSRKLPVMAGYFVENQKSLFEYCKRKKLIFPLGDLNRTEGELEAEIRENIKKIGFPHPVNIDFKGGRKKIINAFKSLK